MAKAILIPYLSLGLLMAVMAFLFSGERQARFLDFYVDRINRSVLLRILSRTWPRRIVFQATRLVSSLIVIIAWPVLVPSFVRGAMSGIGSREFSYRETNAKARLASLHINTSVTVTLFAAVVLLLRVRSNPDWIIDLSCYLILASFAARLAYNLLQNTDLPSMLKQNLLHPYLQFGMVALIDYVGLLLAALALDWNDGDKLRFAALVSQAKNIAAFSHVTQIFRNVPHTLDSVMITLGALTFAVMIVGQATRFKQFKRTPKDHAQIIVDLITLGRWPAALTRLQRLSDTERADSHMALPRTLVAIKEGNNDFAYRLIESEFIRNSDTRSLKYSSSTPDDICAHLIVITFLIGKFTPKDHRSVIQYAIDQGITDGCLCHVLVDIGDFPVFETPEDLRATGIVVEKYPLSHAACMAIQFGPDDPDSVLVELTVAMSTMTPSGTTDQIVRDALLIIYRQRLGTLDEAVLGRLLDQLDNIASMPGWLALHCCLMLMQIERAIPAGSPLLARVKAQIGRFVARASEEEARRFQTGAEAVYATFLDEVGTPPLLAVNADTP